MSLQPDFVRSFLLSFVLCGVAVLCTGYAVAASGDVVVAEFPPALQSYNDAGQPIVERLIHRIKVNPFNLVGTLIFLFAIIHTFLASKFMAISHRLEGLLPLYFFSIGQRRLTI